MTTSATRIDSCFQGSSAKRFDDPEGHALLDQLKSLTSLTIWSPEFDDELLLRAVKGKALESLAIQWTNCTPQVLRHLQDISSLRHLQAFFNDTAQTLPQLALPQLTRLEIGSSDGGVFGLSALGDLPNVRQLLVSNMELSDREMEQIASWQNVQRLTLNNTRVSAAQLSCLSALEHLSDLRLFREGGLGDEVLPILHRFPALKTLLVQQTKISKDGLAGFQMDKLGIASDEALRTAGHRVKDSERSFQTNSPRKFGPPFLNASSRFGRNELRLVGQCRSRPLVFSGRFDVNTKRIRADDAAPASLRDGAVGH